MYMRSLEASLKSELSPAPTWFCKFSPITNDRRLTAPQPLDGAKNLHKELGNGHEESIYCDNNSDYSCSVLRIMHVAQAVIIVEVGAQSRKAKSL